MARQEPWLPQWFFETRDRGCALSDDHRCLRYVYARQQRVQPLAKPVLSYSLSSKRNRLQESDLCIQPCQTVLTFSDFQQETRPTSLFYSLNCFFFKRRVLKLIRYLDKVPPRLGCGHCREPMRRIINANVKVIWFSRVAGDKSLYSVLKPGNLETPFLPPFSLVRFSPICSTILDTYVFYFALLDFEKYPFQSCSPFHSFGTSFS